ncbi:hypothetical protein Tco_1371880, partial [Tanacetum coccineum]
LHTSKGLWMARCPGIETFAIATDLEALKHSKHHFSVNSIRLKFIAYEDDSTSKLEHLQSTVNELDHMDPQIRAQIARLEATISRVEARMEKIAGIVMIVFNYCIR